MKARLLFVLLLSASSAFAHKPSDAYLRLGARVGNTLPLRWDVALRDLDRAVGIDTDRDGKITWREVRSADRAIRDTLRAHLVVSVSGHPCRVAMADESPPLITHHSDGAYAVYSLVLDCPSAGENLSFGYDFLFALDPQHRALLREPASDAVSVLTRTDRQTVVHLPTTVPARARLAAAVGHGVHHIWTGYDHLLFLLALLLPAVLRRDEGRWAPVDRLRPALWEVLKVVTAFTAAHSVTLSLAALGALALPSRLVESAIALSVVLAALNNVWPVVGGDRWLAAFVLGLLHGFGFSSTLADLGLSSTALLPTLVGFNLGVELGQAATVAAFVPLAYACRRSRWYVRGVLVAGSLIIAAIATLWLAERALDLVILPR